ncbi:D-alanine--D-alanine ligase family protein [Aeromicrobium sp. Leaf350]|uniref:D-alanine--D-alanine ligase family protein n=1 Tax=Aeromicrobium sp. Leaf350 TaxID=2876565 RepID=UPI001E532679|nr:D-alanine--D-alanine ligase family protein [Aeromicrobium sp. Leaf350]
MISERPASRTRVCLVYGGRSSEHGVSCLTAREVLSVIDPERYDVRAIGITRSGTWVEAEPRWPELVPGQLPEVDEDAAAVPWESVTDADVVFPLLHGPWGEDGTLQGLLDLADVRYVGAGVLASAVGMDKVFAKVVFAAAGLPQVPYVPIEPSAWPADRDRVEARVRALGLPVFVKPSRAGSSSGVVKVETWEELAPAIEKARDFDPKVLVEAGKVGAREVECGIVQAVDGTPQASVVGEVQVLHDSHAFYDFEAKYLDGTSANLVPADLSPTVSERIRAYAVQAFQAIGGEGLARVDFFLDGEDLVINEINTMPGFTTSSMFPLLWEASGVPYAELVDLLLRQALARPTGLR